MENRIPRAAKPPSRLQKRAPASLRLDHGADSAGIFSWDNGGPTPIPLLSPLVLNPAPLPDSTAERANGEPKGRGDEAERKSAPGPVVTGGWRHPALAAAPTEPVGPLVSFFQAQCALVHNM